jgi:ABC-2 type transport system ATP-binding protein
MSHGNGPSLDAPMKEREAISAKGLSKAFGKVVALDNVDLKVQRGTVLALLGPNGAGKTTFIRILATLLRPDSGYASVAGHDVVRDAAAVRSLIGLTGQYAAVDGNLTGRENLEMVGRLYHLGLPHSRERAEQLLQQFELVDAAGRRVRTYSGGMRRRLDLAASLVARPPVLFLDEPTTGLDPRSRLSLWDTIDKLVKEGTTVLLTTQNLEEAERLASLIAVLDRGGIIEQGTAEELKECCGGAVLLQLRVLDRAQTALAAQVLSGFGNGHLQQNADLGKLSLPVPAGPTKLPDIVRRLDVAGVGIYDIGLRPPTLDDVFLTLTGRTTEAAEQYGPGSAGRHGQRVEKDS